MPKRALVRRPGPRLDHGLLTHLERRRLGTSYESWPLWLGPYDVPGLRGARTAQPSPFATVSAGLVVECSQAAKNPSRSSPLTAPARASKSAVEPLPPARSAAHRRSRAEESSVPV